MYINSPNLVNGSTHLQIGNSRRTWGRSWGEKAKSSFAMKTTKNEMIGFRGGGGKVGGGQIKYKKTKNNEMSHLKISSHE